MSSHPDKVPEDQRADAEIKFKQVSQAYEILYDDDKRQMYDMHGMAAFEKGGGAGGPGGMDMDDILSQMFGMGMGGGGMGGMPGMNGGPGRRGPRRGPDEEQHYEVSLEELYKGKTTRFASTKNVICPQCNGSGGKDKAKPKQCDTCHGQGTQRKLQMIGAGLATEVQVPCGTCNGAGQFFKEKERCKRCKGVRTISTKKMLELYIPPGSRQGDRIVLSGEADQKPDQEPGDIVFELVETPHETFSRAGADLSAHLEITLAEALTGFDRVVLKHLDGRGIHVKVEPKGQILRPEQILKVHGEGMPHKRSDHKGDLYLEVDIKFPEDGFFRDDAAVEKLRSALPKDDTPDIKAEEVDEVDFETDADIEGFGAGSDDPRAGAQWEDEDGEGPQGAQCAQQ